MRLKICAVALLSLVVSVVCSAGNSYVIPTTTLSALTSNNTSAANSFTSQTNGNRGAANISKVSIHSLLYVGATTKVYAHLLLWFGQSNHMNVGYSSTDPAQVRRQINDMISRGINGVVIDWYGPNNSIDAATELVMTEAEKHPGFTFAIMVDQGAIRWDSCPGCNPQQALIAQLQYVEQKYFSSPAYMTHLGQPVVTNFNIDLSYSIDWNAVNAALSTHPLFLFQDNGGFSHVLSGGSYSWVMPTTTDYGISYLNSFYDTGMTFPKEQTVGAAYKGFNDTLASWGSGRIMKQQCGQTWLQTFGKVNSFYNSGKQLDAVQLVTWNDYEEGTEIESGIDNCFSVSAKMSGTALQWNITGNENTIDHYVVYISADGKNLMALNTLQPGSRSLNLSSYSLAQGSYIAYVQAVGKPTMINHMSAAVNYAAPGPPPTSGGGGSSNSASIALGASPATLTVTPGHSGSTKLTVTPVSGAVQSVVVFSCSNLPAGALCSFSPASVTPGSSAATSVVTISTSTVAASVLGIHPGERNHPAGGFLLSGLGMMAIVVSGSWYTRKQIRHGVLLAGLAVILCILSSCGGAPSPAAQAAAAPRTGTFTVTINGDSGSQHSATSVTLTIQ